MNHTAEPNGTPSRALKGIQKIKVVSTETQAQPTPKPTWLRVRSPLSPEVGRLKSVLRDHDLHSVCEEASCPNIGECFSHGTATFMIMGRLCTRRCPFCDVAHGRPDPLDVDEPRHLAQAIAAMRLRFVVITSVDRDDLRDGGGSHFAACIREIRAHAPAVRIEALVPDFRGRVDAALAALASHPPDIFNHNMETIPRLYKPVRPGADYQGSLSLLKTFKDRYPHIPTKSGLMVGLGETRGEIEATLAELRAHGCEWLTIGQYLRPSLAHLPVERYVTPEEFGELAEVARGLGFSNVASGPLVRSSYHADRQAAGELVGM
ncbi:MAG: lipoyl synthase [Acidiferrobacter sp.]